MSAPFGKPELHPESIPAELKTRPRWLLWRLEDRNGKPSKTPYQASGALAKVNDPSTWTSFNAALAAYLKGGFSGIGFALSDDDDLLGVDLDKCLDPDTGELEPEAADIVAMLPTYCEVSPSGRGLRLFAFGKLPQGGRRKGKVEMYESGRYLTVTGHRFNGHDSITECTAQLAAVHARVFGTPQDAPTGQGSKRPVPVDTVLDLDDAALLDKARNAKNGGDFERLWAGDTSAHGGDESAADLALCNMLAFWTAGDAARIDRLFRQSGLMRPKWNSARGEAGTYGQWTIGKALSGCKEHYGDRQGVRSEPTSADVEGNWNEQPIDDVLLDNVLGTAHAPPLEAERPPPIPKPEPSIEWIEDFCARQVKTDWLVRGYLEQDCLAVLFGDSSAGKSFIAIDLACHISHGVKWRGKKTAKGVVLYVCGEGRKGLQKRFKAWHEFHCLPMDRVAVRPTKTELCNQESVAALLDEIKQFLAEMNELPLLIVIDTLNRNFGIGSENNSEDMTAFVEGMDALREGTGAAVLVIHHCGHGAKDRSRGSIVLHNALDFEYVLSRSGNQFSEFVTTLKATKAKDSAEPPELAWTWTLQELPWLEIDDDDNPVPVSSVVMIPADVPQCSAYSSRLPASQRIALDALRAALMDHGAEDKGVVSVAEDEWRKTTYDAGISKGSDRAQRYAFQRARDALVADRRVSVQDGRYWIPDPRGTKRNKAEHFPLCSSGASGEGLEEQSGTYSFRNVPHVPHHAQPDDLDVGEIE